MAEELAESEPPSRAPRAAARLAASVRPDSFVVDISDPLNLIDGLTRGRLTAWLAAAAAKLAITGELRARLVNDEQMAAAHERYAGVAGTTDVLTFDLRTPADAAAGPRVMDVDIFACVDEARRQAAGRAHGPAHELLLYILHGLLHCLGHDDHDDAGFARMHALEDEVLEAVGVGRVFESAARAGEPA